MDREGEILRLAREIGKAAQALVDEWAADLNTRNRPERQDRSCQLMALCGGPWTSKLVDLLEEIHDAKEGHHENLHDRLQ